jgi:predicted GNAT superfamily acetyltransferase
MRTPNARLNLHHLGAVSREILPDFYGTTSSALHHGLATDRLFARWEIDHPRVARREAGEAAAPADLEAIPALNEVDWRGGVPASSPPRLDRDEPALRLEIPDDWDAVVRADAGLARECRTSCEGPSRRSSRGGTRRGTSPRPEGRGRGPGTCSGRAGRRSDTCRPARAQRARRV